MTREDIVEKYDISDYEEQPIIHPNFATVDGDGVTGIVLIVGSSGSGKSTILNSIVPSQQPLLEDVPIIDMFSSPENGEKLLLAMGLRSIPTWFRPLNKVSNGEKHRAECALSIDKGYMVIDEFTSVVDRNTAKSLSHSLRKYFDKSKLETLYIASCHRDIEEWLLPDFIYDTDLVSFRKKEYLRRPLIKVDITATNYEDWVLFKKHHYLDSTLSKAVHCYVAIINNQKVGFLAVIHGTGRDIHSYWRESRLVILPEFQGLGLGKALSNTIAHEYTRRGLRYFSKTAHPTLGGSRDDDPKWRGTSTNHTKRTSYLNKDGSLRENRGSFGKSDNDIIRDATRVCFSHEFMCGFVEPMEKDSMGDW